MDPITIGAAIPSIISGGASLVGNLLGGLFGSSSNDRTNETNLQIAREQNQLNRELLHEQQQFAVDSWQKQFDAYNEYNLPKNQVKRLLEAGINPAVLSGSSAQATPVGGIGLPSAAPAAGATMHPYDWSASMQGIGHGIANSVDAYFRNRNIESVTHKNEAETARTRQLSPWEMRQLQMLVRKGGIEGDLAQTELVYQNAIQGQKIAQVFGDTKLQQKSLMLMDKQMLQHDLQNKLFDVQLAYAPKLNEAQLRQYYATVNQIKAQIGLIGEQQNLTAEQRLNEAQKRIGIIVDNGMKGLDFQIKKETKSTAVDLLREDLFNKQDERMARPLELYRKNLGRGANWFITPGSSTLVGDMIEQNQKRDRFTKPNYGNSRFAPRR